MQTQTETPHAEKLVQSIARYIEERAGEAVTLGELSAETGLSPFHLQRVFKKATGVTPKAWARGYRLNRFQAALKTAPSVTDAIYEAGFGAASRAYENVAADLGMKPGSWRRCGDGVEIAYAIAPTEFGYLLVATTARGICAVRLGNSAEELESGFHGDFQRATLSKDDRLSLLVDQILVLIGSDRPSPRLPLDIRATAFQQRVWQHLQTIPRGETRTYSQVAAEIGSPSATRAVARACATNPVALVVPCHRVVGADGSLTGYRWGVDRKRKLLAMERDGLNAPAQNAVVQPAEKTIDKVRR